MRMGYGYARDMLLEGNISNLSNYGDEIGKTIANCFKHEEFDRTKELLDLCYRYDFLDNGIKYEELLEQANDYNSEDVDEVYEILIRYCERHKLPNLGLKFLVHAESALFKFKCPYIARKYLNKTIEFGLEDERVYELLIYAKTNCVDKALFYRHVGKLENFEYVKKLIDFGTNPEDKLLNIRFIVEACYEAIEKKDEVIDYLDTIDIIGMVVGLLDESIENRLDILLEMAHKLRLSSCFKEATKIYQTLIQYEYRKSVCYWGILLCKLKITNNEALIKTGKPFDNIDEYRYTIEEAPGDHIDANEYIKVLKDTKKRRRKLIGSLIGLLIILAFIIGVIFVIVYLYSHGYQDFKFFNNQK